MNRKIFERIMEWDKQKTDQALILTGAPGTGKTYLSLELAKHFHDSYVYLNPLNDHRIRAALLELSTEELPDFTVFLQNYYQIPSEWLNEFLVILDDFDTFDPIMYLVETLITQSINFRFLIITNKRPTAKLSEHCFVCEVAPLQFDEYLKAIGSEWYTEIIQAHYQTKKKIPEIVHKEMLNLFRDYLRIGGMPAAINEYLHTETLNNISSVHRNIYYMYTSKFSCYDESSIIRLKQILHSVPGQLIKENKNYRYNLIRKGATHNLYRKELRYLTDLYLVNKIERAEFSVIDDETLLATTQENLFRLYPNDSGMLYSMIMASTSEFNDETVEENNDPSHERLFQLLSEAYLLQTLSHKNIRTMFWESGSMAKLDFITQFDNCIMPLEIKYFENKRSKSLHAFRQKFPINSCLKFGMQNFETNDQVTVCPIYSLFCL